MQKAGCFQWDVRDYNSILEMMLAWSELLDHNFTLKLTLAQDESSITHGF
jgi:hypothetical protein